MQLERLTAAPWQRVPYGGDWKDRQECLAIGHPTNEEGICDASHSWEQIVGGWCAKRVNIEFICLARNAFDVMMRRGWHPEKRSMGWMVCEDMNGDTLDGSFHDDPFSALVAADAWYREHVEAKQ